MSMLSTYVAGWRESVDAVLELVDGLGAADASTPTDCPGWTVQDVVAHTAHLESIGIRDTPDTGAADAGGLPSTYTEAGVAERRGLTLAELSAEIRHAVARRSEQLEDLPDDPDTPAPVTPGGIDWTWDTLLRNRCVDIWVHEQDIRRALGRPGGFDGTAAQVVAMTFSFAMPYVLGKQVRPPAGTVVRWDVTGPVPVDLAVVVGEDGRAHRLDTAQPSEATGPVTTLRMDTETFTVLAAGRRTRHDLTIEIDGDESLAHAVLDAMAVTP
ncbi:maleylpyruvate isomerase family mycothiol-dependent enzyme [Aeromicrobium sp. CF3.5]|uniref:maleylpyruvate isomerase family mycothiol-dependent enzyme n=1 Tax=Aeromicrobium sp. CF3.5 TaxID=3373078 RepID=UPI003EE53F4B